ncbi:MAG TPA: lysophospholipid acyltransferase family protein [Gemmatimonadaceae bacterium]|nr:lysophospholipid acyltransferase family protein [Gemmatimonadaceae bacterium]
MLYAALRGLSGLALRWFYRDVEVVGADRIPARGPLLIAANHPNALIDALLVGLVVPRRVLLTAKATLFDNPLLAPLLHAVGVVPLRRASDERAAGAHPDAPPAPARNEVAFRAVLDALAAGGAVLIFPEGKSHDEPALAPLRTGAARMALEARDGRGVRGLAVLPVGLTFEAKERPRSRVAVVVGEPLALDGWAPGVGEEPVAALTAELDARLRGVTLNFPSVDAARRAHTVAGALADVLDEPRRVGEPGLSWAEEMRLVARVDAAARRIGEGAAGPEAAERAAEFERRLDVYCTTLAREGIALEDVAVDLGVRPAARFVLREGLLAVVAAPVSLWGRVNHWLPLRLARAVAQRMSRSREDPAMVTVVAGVALVLAFYAAQAALVWALAGWPWALAYVVTLPPSATWDFRYGERARRARERARTYLRLRREPTLRGRLMGEVEWLRRETAELAGVVEGVPTADV